MRRSLFSYSNINRIRGKRVNLFHVLLFAVSIGLLCLGCSRSEDYTMGQTIEMGPFAFQVESASVTTPDDGHPVVFVNFRLLSDESQGKIPFDRLLNDEVDSEGNATARKMIIPIVFPWTAVVDSHGHRFVGNVIGLSGRYIIWEIRLRDQDRFDKAHRDMQAEDFRLVIKNPDRRKGQPHTASIQLR